MGIFRVIGEAAVAVAFPVPYVAVKGASYVYKKNHEKEIERVREEVKAEYAKEYETINSKLREAAERFKDYRNYEEFLVASFAVAISVAYCDGEFSQEESDDIKEFIGGIAFARLPQIVKDEIQKLFINPPSFNDAMEFVKKTNRNEWEIFDEIIEMVIHSDNIERAQETAFKEAWRRFKAA